MAVIEEAESVLVRALAIASSKLGADHPVALSAVDDVVSLYVLQKRHAEAEALLQEKLRTLEKNRGSLFVDVVSDLDRLASIQAALGKTSEAKLTSRRAAYIRSKTGQ